MGMVRFLCPRATRVRIRYFTILPIPCPLPSYFPTKQASNRALFNGTFACHKCHPSYTSHSVFCSISSTQLNWRGVHTVGDNFSLYKIQDQRRWRLNGCERRILAALHQLCNYACAWCTSIWSWIAQETWPYVRSLFCFVGQYIAS
jgi:hypothetical protein